MPTVPWSTTTVLPPTFRPPPTTSSTQPARVTRSPGRSWPASSAVRRPSRPPTSPHRSRRGSSNISALARSPTPAFAPCCTDRTTDTAIGDGWQAVVMTTSTDRFRSLHSSGIFVMPNPYDMGSARLLAASGFTALASTSSGFAATLGRLDMTVNRDELLPHVEALARATELPLNVDSERCFAEDAAGVTETVQLLGDAGAAGCSIEDWNPMTNAIDPMETAAERVAAAAAGATRSGLVLTARCENHLHGVDDLDNTIARLQAYIAAGAEVVYAPGLRDVSRFSTLVRAVGVPVNALILPGGPSVAELGEARVRRISTGGLLSRISHGAMVAAAERLRDEGVVRIDEPFLSGSLAKQALHD